jgi:DNA-binding LacI/PurR family transcriptional regulator
MAPTRLKDIAAAGNVSLMTVSKVLRDAPDISSATKTRIRRLAEQMGYFPDTAAQGLRNRKTKLLGLVISAITNPAFARVVLALEERAFQLGYDLIIAHSLNDPEREEMVLRRLLSRRVDGLFVAPVYRLAPVARVYSEILSRSVPTVVLGGKAPFCQHFPNVEGEDFLASRAATQHLISLGHKRIAYFAGPMAAPAAQERVEGYRKALREAEIEVDDHLIFQAGNTIEDGEKAALQLLNESIPCTAIQAFNDSVAVGAGTVYLKQGIRIPKDLSLVGFGNTLISEHFRVPLTTSRQPKHRLGMAAMDMMERLLRGEQAESRRIPAHLVIRESTAAPPS